MYIPGKNQDAERRARRWFADPKWAHVYQDLEDWADSRASDWGAPRLYLETVLAVRGYPVEHRQPDMILTFDDHVIVCEIKSHPHVALSEVKERRSDELNLFEAAFQLNCQLNLLTQRVKGAGFHQRSIVPCLHLFALSNSEARAAQRALVDSNDYRHLHVTCASVGPHHLVSQIQRSIWSSDRIREGLGDCVHKYLGETGKPWIEHHDVKRAQDSLRNLIIAVPHVQTFDSWYVPELRSGERKEAAEKLLRHGVLEVVGPAGVGRLTFMKELAREYCGERRIYPYPISGATNIQQLCRKLYRELENEEPEWTGERLVHYILDANWIFLLDHYSRGSIRAIRSLLEARSGAARDDGTECRSLWIVRSQEPRVAPKDAVFRLRLLEDDEIAEILMGCEPGNSDVEATATARLARGNPGLARNLWLSTEGGQATRRWVGNHLFDVNSLLRPEKRLLELLCASVHDAPLGVTMGLLKELAIAETPALGEETPTHLDALVKKLAEGGVLRLDVFDAGRFRGILGVEDYRSSFALIQLADVAFVEEILESADPDVTRVKKRALLERLGNRYDHSAGEHTLASVTYALHCEELEPFFRSSFRLTQLHLPMCVEWLESLADDKVRWEQTDEKQRYLGHALRLLVRLSRPRDFAVDIDRELGTPPDDPATKYAYEVVRARMMSRSSHTPSSLARWEAEARAIENADLRPEVLIRVAEAQREGALTEKAGVLLRELLDSRSALSSTAHGLIAFHGIRTITTKKRLEKYLGTEQERRELHRALLSELVEIGLKQENVVTLANAMFFAARAQAENLINRGRRDALLRYLPVLQTVGRTTPSRHLQAMLSEFRVLCAYCGDPQLAAAEYEEQSQRAVRILGQLFGALGERGLTYRLHASRMGIRLCRSGMRYERGRQGRDHARSICRAVAEHIAETIEFTPSRLRHRSEKLHLRVLRALMPIVEGAGEDDRRMRSRSTGGIKPGEVVADELEQLKKEKQWASWRELLILALELSTGIVAFARVEGAEKRLREWSECRDSLIEIGRSRERDKKIRKTIDRILDAERPRRMEEAATLGVGMGRLGQSEDGETEPRSASERKWRQAADVESAMKELGAGDVTEIRLWFAKRREQCKSDPVELARIDKQEQAMLLRARESEDGSLDKG